LRRCGHGWWVEKKRSLFFLVLLLNRSSDGDSRSVFSFGIGTRRSD
jgi:hypothetical protein